MCISISVRIGSVMASVVLSFRGVKVRCQGVKVRCKKYKIMEEIIDFALWLNTQRIKETQYMGREELEEMYLIYIEEIENESE